jgi:hypothetical protein
VLTDEPPLFYSSYVSHPANVPERVTDEVFVAHQGISVKVTGIRFVCDR